MCCLRLIPGSGKKKFSGIEIPFDFDYSTGNRPFDFCYDRHGNTKPISKWGENTDSEESDKEEDSEDEESGSSTERKTSSDSDSNTSDTT